MKRKALLFLLIPALLASCGDDGCKHVDEDKDHFCDLCKARMSEHSDENKDHDCDYCGRNLGGHVDYDCDFICDYCGQEIEPPTPYATWPEKEIQDEVIVVSGSEVKIPEYKKADDIEINTDDEIEGGYFSIYCYTENANSENEYKQILINAGWEVDAEKDDNGFYNAWDSKYEVWLNFRYDIKWKDLEICVTRSLKTGWPGETIATCLGMLVPGTKTTIPQFEADIVYVNYYDQPSLHGIAINAYAFKESIIEDYKQILQNNNWSVSYNDTSKEWNAFSKDQDVEMHFYIDSDQFNVDLLRYQAPVANWPYDEIQEAIDFWEATGTIVPFVKEGVTFQFDWSGAYPGVLIYCEENKKEEYRDEYNQMLLDKGYIYVGDFVGEPLYAYPGTTLAYRATILMGVLQIETMLLEAPAQAE